MATMARRMNMTPAQVAVREQYMSFMYHLCLATWFVQRKKQATKERERQSEIFRNLWFGPTNK